ncbi:MAG: S-layer homology domain-containing protein, partial [Clostridia bacterium]|nr:S-layer homology domain-containing protein [Clostridia bacterium]
EAYGKNWFRAESLGRVTINEINSKPVDTGALYAVITSNANYNGMDSSYIFKEAVEDNDRCAITTAIVRDVVWMYVNEALNNYVSAEYQAPQNRITCVGRVFDDVPADHFAFDAISWAAENGIAAGVTETTFEPARICTRAEAVGYLWMANGAPISAEPLMFSDLTEDDAITPAAVWASEMGISNGTGNGKFSPDMAMTRGQIVTMLYRAAGMPEVKDASGFDDVAEGMYYADAAAWAVAQGITNGVGDNKFAPDVICTHAEIITMLYRELAK